MQPGQIVVDAPSLNDAPGLSQAGEPARVEAFLAEAAVEDLDLAVLHRLAGIDEEQLHAVLVGPALEITTAQLGSVVHDQHIGIATYFGDILEHADHPLAGQRDVDNDGRALTRAVVLEVGGAEPAAVGQAVLDEVQGPALV